MTILRRLATVFPLVLLAASCGGDSGSPVDPGSPVPATVSANAGDQQQAAGGASVPVAPSVIVRDAQGNPVPGVAVNFTVTAGGGTVTGGSPSTNGSGVATVSGWALGPVGAQRLSARVGSLPEVVFEAGIIPGTEQLIATMGAGGGTFAISDPASPYDGLTLTVPAGTVTGSAEWRFRVDQQPLAIPLPAGIRVVGPAMEISTNQAFGGRLMTLEVPARTNPGELAFVGLYDPIRGVTELMPTVDRTDSTVVVVTYHLRGDLLGGSTPPGALHRAGMAIGFDGPPAAADELMPRLVVMAMNNMENLLTAFMEFETQLNKWPVRDHGSAALPEGHGTGIAVLQAVGSAEGSPPFESIVRSLPTEGFYAEAAPLAAAQIAERTYGPEVNETMRRLREIYSKHAKADRDALVVQDVVANARLNPRTAMLAVLSAAMDDRPVVASVVGGSGGALTLQSPAASSPTALSVGPDGLGTARLPLVGDGPDHEVSDLVPINSFTYRTAEARALVETLGRMTQAATESQRDAINTQLATQAGLPEVRVEIRHLPADSWVPSTDLNAITIRSQAAQLRVLANPATVHLPDGSEITRSGSGEAMSIADDLGVASASTVTQVGRTISAYTTSVGGAIRQVAVAQARVTVAPFEVTPDEVTLSTDNRTVELEAAIPLPPDGGFRIEWDWGDGEKTEHLGLMTASHEFGGLGETYDIVATLMTNAERRRLAVDTVRVRARPSVWVGSATVARTNNAPGFQGTMRAEATDLRLERVAEVGPSAARFHVVSGHLTAWNEVPCAGYVSPISQATLTNSDLQWLVVSDKDPSASEGTDSGPGLWYNGNAYTGGLEIFNKVCPSEFNPNPQAYRFATGIVWLTTHDGSGDIWTHSANRNLIQGSVVRHGTDNSTTVWTWRFERADE